MAELHNPTNVSRLCFGLGENVEPFEVREVPDGFEHCPGCRCVIDGEPAQVASEGPVAAQGPPETAAAPTPEGSASLEAVGDTGAEDAPKADG